MLKATRRLTFFLFLVLAAPLEAAVGYDTAQTPGAFSSNAPGTPWAAGSYTPASGSSRLVIGIFGCGSGSGAGAATGVTLGGQSMTQVGSAVSNGDWTNVTAFLLKEAGIVAMSGSSISATLSDGNCQMSAVFFTLTGVDQTTSTSGTQTGSATSGTTAQASASVTSTSDGMVVAGVNSDVDALNDLTASHSDDGDTMKAGPVGNDTVTKAQYTAGTGGSINLSWTQAVSHGYSVIAFNVNGTGGGAAAPRRLLLLGVGGH